MQKPMDINFLTTPLSAFKKSSAACMSLFAASCGMLDAARPGRARGARGRDTGGARERRRRRRQEAHRGAGRGDSSQAIARAENFGDEERGGGAWLQRWARERRGEN